MTADTTCEHCGQPLEYEVENADQITPCPSCGKDTQLSKPVAEAILIAPPKKWKMDRKILWCLAAGLPLAVAIIAGLIFMKDSGEGIRKFIGILIACLTIGLVIWLLFSYFLQILTALFVCVGLFLIISGVADMATTSALTERTVFHQIYSLHEFVGGSLVFCAAMILHILRTRLNPVATKK